MKPFLLFVLACCIIGPGAFADNKNKKKEAGQTNAAAAPVDDKDIHWMSLDDVQVAMKKEPRKVWIDVYTDWCGWCKRMDKTTFSNPNVIRYMNEHFYAVKMDAEQKSDIRIMGKMYNANPAEAAHPFAKELLHGSLSYPTSVVMEENFQTPQPIPGYQDVKTIEMIMKFFGEGFYKKTPWAEFQAAFKPSWL